MAWACGRIGFNMQTLRKIDDHQQKQMRMCEGYLHVLMTLGKYEYIDYSLEI